MYSLRTPTFSMFKDAGEEPLDPTFEAELVIYLERLLPKDRHASKPISGDPLLPLWVVVVGFASIIGGTLPGVYALLDLGGVIP